MKEKKNTLEKVKENKWKILTGVCFTATVALGAMYGMEVNKNKQANDTANLVKRVVGGPLIDRLITNEELKLSRENNKINNILSNEMTKATEIEVKEHYAKRQNIIETISDFVKVREALK